MLGYEFWTNHGEERSTDEGHASTDEVNDMHDVYTTIVYLSTQEVREIEDDVTVDDASS